MSSDKNHSEQFKKYLNGEMTPSEANAFERKALDDPFTQEALEGMEGQNTDQLFSTIEELKKQITAKSKKGFSWMKIAAVVTLLMVSAFALWFSVSQTESTSELAIQEKAIPASPIDSITSEKPIVENEEMVAEAEVIEDTSIKKFKDDGVRVADTNELIDKDLEDQESIQPVPIITLAEADVQVDEITELDESTPEMALQGKVAGVEMVEQSPVTAENPVIDSSELIAEDLITQTLVAQENISESKRTYSNDDTSKKIVIRGQSSLARSASSENMTVTGKVTDETGEPMPGVSVIIKGTTMGTQTDLDGNYMLPKLNEMSLVFSFVGFESQEVEVGARTSIDVSMGGATELQEVVVTATRLEREKKALGYAITEVENKTGAKPKVGNKEYSEYLKENLQYPEQAKINAIEGTVTLELTISPKGEISNIDIKKSLGYGCDEEAIRLINDGPKWQAAEREGIRVEDKIKIKVNFKL